jgi:hypothetical protein
MAQIDEPLQGSLQVCAGQGLLTSFSAMAAPEWRCRVIYIPQVTHIHRRTREWMLYCNFLLDNSRHCHLWLELRRNLSRSVANTTQDVDTRQRSSSSGVRTSKNYIICKCSAFHAPILTNIALDLEDITRDIEQQLLLESGKMSQPWTALSGGERQRAAIGCALVLSRSLQSQVEWDANRK